MACIRLSSTIALCSSHQLASSASFSNFGTFGLSALLAMSVQSYLCQILFSKPFVRFESRYWPDGFLSHCPDHDQDAHLLGVPNRSPAFLTIDHVKIDIHRPVGEQLLDFHGRHTMAGDVLDGGVGPIDR